MPANLDYKNFDMLKIFVATRNKMNNWLHRMIDEAPAP